MNDLRHRLRNKLMIQKAIQAAIKTPTKEEVDNLIAEQLAIAALKAKSEESDNENYFIWHDGRDTSPIQSLLIDVMFDFLKRDPNMQSITINTKCGKTLVMSLK